jgi:hypothetical protein
MLFRKIIAYSKNHVKLINTLCGQNAQLLNIKAGGTYSYQKLMLAYKEVQLQIADSYFNTGKGLFKLGNIYEYF